MSRRTTNPPPTRVEPTEYEISRSHTDHRLYVISYADRFYEDVPLDVINRGPWPSGRGEVAELRPDIREALRRDGHFVVESDAARFNTRKPK